MMTKDFRTLAAYHEAGHAICCIAVGGVVRAVDIEVIDGRGGLCRIIPPEDLTKKIEIDMAGAAAEADLRLRRGRRYDSSHRNDLSDTDDELRKLYGAKFIRRDNCPEFIEAEQLAKRIIGENWGAVRRLAQWLLYKGSASGAMAQAIVTSHNIARKERVSV